MKKFLVHLDFSVWVFLLAGLKGDLLNFGDTFKQFYISLIKGEAF